MPSGSAAGFVLGVGLSAQAEAADMIALAEQAIAGAELDGSDVLAIAAIASRRDHPALLALAAHFDCEIQVFDIARLEAETPRLKNPSAALYARIGCHGVAEAAALAAAGRHATLVVEKLAGTRVTVAIAR